MAITLLSPEGQLPLHGTPQWKLTAGNDPPQLMLSAVSDATDQELIAFAETGEAVLTVDVNGGATELFRGRIGELQRAGRTIHITAISPAGALNEVDQTRTFAPPARAWCAISELTGVRAAFPTVQGIELLTAIVPQLTQYDETDWRFLQRAAWLSGKVLVCDNGQPRVMALGEGRRELAADQVVAETVCWETKITSVSASSNSWNQETGNTPAGARAEVELAGAEAAGLRAGRDLLPEATNEFPLTLPSNSSLQDWATRQAAGASAQAFCWQGGVLDPTLRPGDLVVLPTGSVTTNPLRVVECELRHAAELPGSPLLNTLTLRAGLLAPPQPSGLKLQTAQVVHVQDAEKLGQIAVRLVWQQEGEQVFASVPQTMSGGFGQPLVGDWVLVLITPHTIALPVVLGTVFRGDAPARHENGSSVLEWRLPEGLFLRFDRVNRRIELGIESNGGPPIVLEITPEHLKFLGDVQVANKLIFI